MEKRKKYLFKDRLIKGITNDGFFKISVVKTTDVVKMAKEDHGLSMLNTVILGRALTGSLLLASELKGEERIRIQVQGNGPIGMLIAEANAVGETRGYVQNPLVELDYSENTQIGKGLGIGVLTFSKTLYNEAHPITGTVELINGNVTEDLAYYLFQSEQIPSAISLDVGIDENGDVTHAGGILIQALPGAPEKSIDLLQENLKNLVPLSDQFASQAYIDDLLEKVTYPFESKELSRFPVHFFCRCTRDRFVDAINMLTLDDLDMMKTEDQELVCHYCSKKYTIPAKEIAAIAEKMRIKLN